MQRSCDAAVIAARIEVYRDRHDREEDDTYKAVQLLIFERRLGSAGEDAVINIKVHAEEQLKHRGDDLNIQAVELAEARVARREAAGTGRGKGVAERFIYAHPAAGKQHEHQKRHADVDEVEYLRRLAHARHELADCRSRELRTHDVHRMLPAHRHYRQHEHQHTHAAYPLGQQPPQHAAPAERLNVGQHRSAGRREAGHGLKQRIDKIRYVPAQNIRQRAEERHEHPRKAYGKKAVAREQLRRVGLYRGKRQPERKAQRDAQHERAHVLPVYYACQQRHQHQPGQAQQHHTQHTANHPIVHYFTLYISISSRTTWQKAPASGKTQVCPQA